MPDPKEERDLELVRLRELLKVGTSDLAEGRSVSFSTEAELKAFFDKLARPNE